MITPTGCFPGNLDGLPGLAPPPAPPLVAAVRCAFDRCQAGGVILPRAPRVDRIRPGTQFYLDGWYHPGCWAAEQRRSDEFVTPETQPAGRDVGQSRAR